MQNLNTVKFLLAITILVSLITSCGGSNLPVIERFTTTSEKIIPGKLVSLEWSSKNATSLTLEPGFGDVTGLSRVAVTPSQTTNYTLTASNADGEVKRVVTLEVTAPASSESLSLETSIGDGSVSGKFGNVLFSASKGATPGSGIAQFSVDNLTLQISLSNPEQGELIWEGLTLDGYGALSAEEKIALEALAASSLYEAVVMVPLYLACRRDDVDPAAGAALLMPWQMLLKYMYADRIRTIEVLASYSDCGFFKESIDETQNSSPSPAIMMLSSESPIPSVFSYFPFDAEGAAETTSELKTRISSELQANIGQALSGNRDEFGAGNSKCRGACGEDCKYGCTKSTTTECKVNKKGQHGQIIVEKYDCGTHQGCRDHDACYDNCNKGREGSWGAAICRRGCDALAIIHAETLLLPIPGYAIAAGWAFGLPPHDGRMQFEYTLTRAEIPSDEKEPFINFTPCGDGRTCSSGLCSSVVEVNVSGNPNTASVLINSLSPAIFYQNGFDFVSSGSHRFTDVPPLNSYELYFYPTTQAGDIPHRFVPTDPSGCEETRRETFTLGIDDKKTFSATYRQLTGEATINASGLAELTPYSIGQVTTFNNTQGNCPNGRIASYGSGGTQESYPLIGEPGTYSMEFAKFTYFWDNPDPTQPDGACWIPEPKSATITISSGGTDSVFVAYQHYPSNSPECLQ